MTCIHRSNLSYSFISCEPSVYGWPRFVFRYFIVYLNKFFMDHQVFFIFSYPSLFKYALHGASSMFFSGLLDLSISFEFQNVQTHLAQITYKYSKIFLVPIILKASILLMYCIPNILNIIMYIYMWPHISNSLASKFPQHFLYTWESYTIYIAK